jgi:hypothetical protein
VDHILQEFYTLFLTRFRTYKIALPSQTKMTSKDDIKGLVSLSSFVHATFCWIRHAADLLKTRGGPGRNQDLLIEVAVARLAAQHETYAHTGINASITRLLGIFFFKPFFLRNGPAELE